MFHFIYVKYFVFYDVIYFIVFRVHPAMAQDVYH